MGQCLIAPLNFALCVPWAQSAVLQRQAPPARKTLSRGRDTKANLVLLQEEIVEAFAAVEARDDWLPGTAKTEMAS